MKNDIIKIVDDSVASLFKKEILQNLKKFSVEKPKNKKFGDFSCNISMVLAPLLKKNPKEIATILKEDIEDKHNIFSKIEIAGAGFLNFFIKQELFQSFLKEILIKEKNYGKQNIGNSKKIMIEFVSANPTGPLHIGHGRGAVFGDVLSNLLNYLGFDVYKEYYLNDRGLQVENLGLSVFLRKKELEGEKVDFPEGCYKGDYIIDIAKKLPSFDGNKDEAVKFFAKESMAIIIKDISKTLNLLNVDFNNWFSEDALFNSNEALDTIAELSKKKLIYEKDGATWFKSQEFGDEKDRVIKRSNGEITYFFSDIVYHRNKFKRGFEEVINIWGADHHGYIDRMKAAVSIFNKKENLKVLLIQLVNLFKNKKPVSMSKRKGDFITLKDLILEVGIDATRFLFLSRHHESTIDFDMELAKKKNSENPVYYVQYVYARISNILKKAEEESLKLQIEKVDNFAKLLKEQEEIDLIKYMIEYPEVLKTSAEKMEVHHITFYLIELSSAFHSYYNKHKVISDDKELSLARLYLISAVKIIVGNGLNMLKVSTPLNM